MNLLDTVPLRDWAALVIGLAGLVVGYLQSQNRLPKWARQWLSKIGTENVEEAIAYAAMIANLTPDQRRQEAVAYLIRLSEKELGFPIPESIANLLVEFVYQQVKRGK